MDRLKHRYIVVEGPIGVGKTTLTRALCKRFRGRGLYEIVEENPFLASFAKDRIFASITLDPNELALYERVYEHLGPRVLKPDLVIYLQARLDVLLARIKKRGREFERRFDADYLSELSRTYNDFFHRWDETPLLVINTSDIDFAESEQDLDDLVRAIARCKPGTQYYQPLGTRV